MGDTLFYPLYGANLHSRIPLFFLRFLYVLIYRTLTSFSSTSHFMEPEGSLPRSHVPASEKSSPHLATLYPSAPLYFHLRLGFLNSLQVFCRKCCSGHSLPSPYANHACYVTVMDGHVTVKQNGAKGRIAATKLARKYEKNEILYTIQRPHDRVRSSSSSTYSMEQSPS